MILNDRKIKILEAIINDYILTAEPIGSRTIAKKYDLGISSATVRNEMSDLEDMGLIVQPHASAGRVPSDKGYRYYVDSMMQYRELNPEQTAFLQQLIIQNINQIDDFMKEIAKSIAILTHYTTIVSEPQFIQTKVKHVQLVPLDEQSIVLVLVTDSKAIKNSIIRMHNPPVPDKLGALSAVLNDFLQGQTFADIKTNAAAELLTRFAHESDVLAPVLDAILNVIKIEDEVRIYTSGVKNILAFPEFSNLDKARAIFQTLEEKEMLITLLDHDKTDLSGNIQVVIGSENTMEQMKDCSVIKANYKIGDQTGGMLGIIGPTRMDYAQVVSTLYVIVEKINQALGALNGG